MFKIWEIDFTSFSGIYPVDNINNIPAVGAPSSVDTVNPLPGFTVRSGISISPNGNYQAYSFDSGSSYTGCSGNFSGPYTVRSFVCWFYLQGDSETGLNGLDRFLYIF